MAKIIQNDEVVSFLEKRGARDLVVDDDDVHFYEIMGMNDIDLSLNKEKANLFYDFERGPKRGKGKLYL